MKLLGLLALAVVAWLIFRHALPHDDESIGLPNVEPPEDSIGWPW